MQNSPKNRLCLGTAQFGMNYGIANKGGKILKEEVFEMLKYSFKAGIVNLDTAYSYGDSEKVIGEFCYENNCGFKVISKLPSLQELSNKTVEEAILCSLRNLRTKQIYGYLIHKFEDFLQNPSLWRTLEDSKEKKLIEKIGFSVYTVEQLQILFDKKVTFDIIQLPYSIFDRRFEKYFSFLNANGIEIYARSVFLQGLAFLNPSELKGNLQKAKNKLLELNIFSSSNAVTINSLCLNFVLLNPSIDKAIIGVDNLRHLKANIHDLNDIEKLEAIYRDLDRFSIQDKDVILPYRWK